MAAQKQKAELIAIYRLEFYKKQKNWKLSTDARKEKVLRNSCPTTLVKNSEILNETYSVETNTDNNASVLNEAFLKDESDKDALVSPTAQTNLSAQWLEPINACQECQHTDIKPQNPWSDYVNDGLIGDSDIVDKCSGDGNEFEGFDGWAEGMVWTNSGIPKSLWTGDMPVPMNIQGAECPEQLAWTADNMLYHQVEQRDQLTLWPDDQMWVPDIWGNNELLSQSLETEDEFMIGAHSAPHSSELELRVLTEGDGGGPDVSQGSLSRMSGAALSAAVRRHTGSLRRLLREAGQRRKCRSTLSLDVCAPDHFGLVPRDFFGTEYSYEAFPTRDVSFTPLSPVYMGKDGFAPLPLTNQGNHDFAPLSLINHCKDGFTQLPPTSQYNEGLAPHPPTNHCKDGFTPLPPTNYCKDGFTPLAPTNSCKDGFTPLAPTNSFKDGFTPLAPTNQCKDDFTSLQPANHCKSFFTPVSPANMYRDGFLAGSHRNKIPLDFTGRGRGRLQEGRGVEV